MHIVLQLEIAAYDSAFPNNRVMEQLSINVLRNPNAPRFDQNSYSKRISETFPVGEIILQVAATDQDSVSTDLYTHHI